MPSSKKNIALTHATLLDMAAGAARAEETTIIVKDGRIAAVGRGLPVPYGYSEIDLDGRFVLPGLVNLCARLYESGFPGRRFRDPVKDARRLMSSRFGRMVAFNRCAAYARTEFMSGVTTLVTPGGLGNVDRRLKEAAEANSIHAPRLLISNMALATDAAMAAAEAACVARSGEDAGQLAARMISGHADQITLLVGNDFSHVKETMRNGDPGSREMSRAEGMVREADLNGKDTPGAEEMVRSACSCANAAGLKVFARCEGEEAVRIALKCGVSVIICSEELGADTLKLILQNKTALICPISPKIPGLYLGDEDEKAAGRAAFERAVAACKAAVSAGVTVGLGTDPGQPYVTHYDMWREMEYFRRYVGVQREAAIRIATIGNAAIAGVERETGSIEPGKSADLIVADRDPASDLEALRDLYMVMLRGTVVMQPRPMKNEACDELLDKNLRVNW